MRRPREKLLVLVLLCLALLLAGCSRSEPAPSAPARIESVTLADVKNATSTQARPFVPGQQAWLRVFLTDLNRDGRFLEYELELTLFGPDDRPVGEPIVRHWRQAVVPRIEREIPIELPAEMPPGECRGEVILTDFVGFSNTAASFRFRVEKSAPSAR